MTQKNNTNAYIITGDEPIQAKTMKRLLLFYNRVFFSDIKDEAIVNENELIETFPGAKVGWSARGHYPRISNYKEHYFESLKGAQTALNRQLIQPIDSRNIKTIDPGTHWLCYNASLSNLDLAKAAAIDASEEKPLLAVPNTIYCGAEISLHGMKSKYAVEYKEPVALQNIHEDWNWICRLRVGRAIKSIRLAQALNAAPIATDNVNSQIAFSLAKNTAPFIYPNDSILDLVISTEIIDNEKLESTLSDSSWNDILKIRKEILPYVNKTKEFINKKTKHISNCHYNDIDDYKCSLNELKTELASLQEQEAEAWEALRIGSVLKAGATVGAGALGTIAIPAMSSLPNTIITLISVGLISAAGLKPELQKLIPARRKVREHPLFFLEKFKINA